MTGEKVAASPQGAAVKLAVEPFDYCGVSLTEGRLKLQFDEVRDYYLRVPNDDLLHGYRMRAGLPAPGVELGGWYTADAGNTFPQILSGLARMYASTGDDAILDKANYLLAEWGKCIGPDGYFFYTDSPTSLQYFYEKMVTACLDMHRYCDNKDALGYLSRITDWAIKNLDRTNEYANACGDRRDPRYIRGEWYTVSESLYRAYMTTGDTKYKDFAEVWEYTEFWDLLANKESIFGKRPNGEDAPWYHAYSHVNTFASAATAYLVKGEQHYLDAVRNAYDFLQEGQTYATGGYGPGEELMPRERFVKSLVDSPNHCEVQCGSWATFKMVKYLTSFTGDAKYGDWVERVMHNVIGADLPMAADGQMFYYVKYHLQGQKKELSPGTCWACCSGTRPQVIADYYDQVYYKDAGSLYVSLYMPSSVEWEHPDGTVTVSQKTRFPESDTVEFAVSAAKPTEFTLKLRIPGWLAGPMTASVNGEKIELCIDDLHWAEVRREWRDGDKLVVTLPMDFWVSKLDEDRDFPAAIMYGPLVMAFRSLDGSPVGKIDFGNLPASFVPSPGEPLTFHLASDPNVLVRPFYAFREGQPYYMYLDPTPPPAAKP